MNHEVPGPRPPQETQPPVDDGELLDQTDSQEQLDTPEQMAAREVLSGLPQLTDLEQETVEDHVAMAMSDVEKIEAAKEAAAPRLEERDAKIEELEAKLKIRKDKIANARFGNSWAINRHRSRRNNLEIKINKLKKEKEDIEATRDAHKKEWATDDVKKTEGYAMLAENLENIDTTIKMREELRERLETTDEDDPQYAELADRFIALGDPDLTDEELREELTDKAKAEYQKWMEGAKEKKYVEVDEQIRQRMEDMDRISHPEDYPDMNETARLELVKQSQKWPSLQEYVTELVGEENIEDFQRWLQTYAGKERREEEAKIMKDFKPEQTPTESEPDPKNAEKQKERERVARELQQHLEKQQEIGKRVKEASDERDSRSAKAVKADEDKEHPIVRNGLWNDVRKAEKKLRTESTVYEGNEEEIRKLRVQLQALSIDDSPRPTTEPLPQIPDHLKRDLRSAEQKYQQRLKVARLWQESQGNS